VHGFGLKVTPAGRKVYLVQYRMAGRGSPTKRVTIGEHGSPWTPDEARQEAIRVRGLIVTGIDPSDKKRKAKAEPKPETFAAVANEFLARYAKPNLRPTSYNEYERILKREVTPTWGGQAISSITRRDANLLLDSIADRGAPILANRTLARLSKLFNWAVEREIVTSSPVAGIKKTRELPRDRALSDLEIALLLRACDELGWPFGPLFKLLLITAQRRDEVATMEWSEVDLAARLWTLPREKSKNGRAHEVQLSDLALELLRSVPHISDRYVFTITGQHPVSGFSRAKTRLDRLTAALAAEQGMQPLSPWTLHDLRRTAATGMAAMNVAPHVVDRILNHVAGTIRGVAAVYNRHSYLEERRSALEAWGRRLTSLAKPPTDNVIAL
jgi:integrase